MTKQGKAHYSTGNGLAYCGTYGGTLTLRAGAVTCKRCRSLLGDTGARDRANADRERTR